MIITTNHKSRKKIRNFYDFQIFFQKGYPHNFWPCLCNEPHTTNFNLETYLFINHIFLDAKLLDVSFLFIIAYINVSMYKIVKLTEYVDQLIANAFVRHEYRIDKRNANVSQCTNVLSFRGQFCQHFTTSFFVQKCFEQLFCTYSSALYFFGKRILAKKLLVKCW